MSLSCIYAEASIHSAVQSPVSIGYDQKSNSTVSITDRIQQLEKLVVTLMKDNSANVSQSEPQVPLANPVVSSPSNTVTSNSMSEDCGETIVQDSASPPGLGRIKVSTSSTSYVSNAHWAAVLDGISDLKDCFEKEDDSPQPEYASPQLLYGSLNRASKSEILNSIPPRPVVDRLVSRYFNALDMAPAVLHSGQFLKEYEKFWENPSDAPIMWLGLLFTMMCLSAQLQQFSIDPHQMHNLSSVDPDPRILVDLFRDRIVQCLILGKYTKGGPYVLETLLLYFTIEHFLSKDAEIGLWILLGIIINLAMRMGYHRDPRYFSGISPAGWPMGLPRNIKEWQTDTSEPRNLFDADFDEHTKELPTSRPETEITPMLHILARNRIASVARVILDFTTDTRPYSYADVMRVEKRLDDAHFTIPSSLRWQPMSASITDTPQIIMQRISLEISFHKWRIALHRKYLFPSRQHLQNAHSRHVCMEAALNILELQDILDQETQPAGQLYEIRWKLSSLVTHDFLLATSILCFCLQSRYGISEGATEVKDINKIKLALKRSHDIWLQPSLTSKESQKAVEALTMVLKKLDPETEPSMLFDYSQTPPPLPADYYMSTSYQGKHSCV
ncbi:hypothetical protein V502_04012 [Pseudogymnoascus sp. VKM F-4520 (FW-2644)]|nr:hypothetical protein V502_04012 [Pseudogymnoascus sp. VKM F-4520 (FW-2644)]